MSVKADQSKKKKEVKILTYVSFSIISFLLLILYVTNYRNPRH